MSVAGAFAAISLAGTAANVIGNIQQAQAAKASSSYNVAVETQNAEAAEVATQDTMVRIGRDRDRLLGRQRAGYVGAGVRVEGSPLDQMNETIRLADQDLWRARVTGDYAGASATARANYARYSGDVAERQGYTNAVGSLLTGVGSVGLAKLQGEYFGGLKSGNNQLALEVANPQGFSKRFESSFK